MKTSQTFKYISIIALVVLSISSFAQKRVELQSKTVKYESRNPNIKAEANTNDKPQPIARGGCHYQFDNYTGLYIKLYVDGYYKGTIDAWGKASIRVNSGYAKVYLVSVGGTREWNSSGDCNSSPYTFVLR
jgi:hypothetical protein